MALKKTITKADNSSGNYIRLINVDFPSYNKITGYKSGKLTFEVLNSIEDQSYFMTFYLDFDKVFFNLLDINNDWNALAKSVYTNIHYYYQLADAIDLI
jgi:hypothetical protein